MLSIEFIRKNKDLVVQAAKNKNRKIDIDQILALDDTRKSIMHEIQRLREERNKISKTKNDEMVLRGKEIKTKLKEYEEKLQKVETDLNTHILSVPNVPLDEVPVGKDETANKQIRAWGNKPSFSFTPKTHIELGTALDVIDLQRGTKVSGFRGYFLKNELAILHMAVMMFALQKLVKKGFTPLSAPSIVKSFSLEGTGQFPWGKQEVYELNDEDAYLSGTAEVPVTSYHANELLDEKNLPLKYVAMAPSFRREVGSYGKDAKGLYRVHEFWKVEQVILTTNDIDNARKLHEELQQNSEELLQELELPYRVLLMSTGDMGEPQILKYDTEVWMPSRNTYGETMSNSIMGDFQTRRLKIKYRKKDGKLDYCFSLNNTALASPRILIALLENHQQEDGSVRIPKALQPFAGFDVIQPKK